MRAAKRCIMRVCCLCGMARVADGPHLCTAEVVDLLDKMTAHEAGPGSLTALA